MPKFIQNYGHGGRIKIVQMRMQMRAVVKPPSRIRQFLVRGQARVSIWAHRTHSSSSRNSSLALLSSAYLMTNSHSRTLTSRRRYCDTISSRIKMSARRITWDTAALPHPPSATPGCRRIPRACPRGWAFYCRFEFFRLEGCVWSLRRSVDQRIWKIGLLHQLKWELNKFISKVISCRGYLICV